MDLVMAASSELSSPLRGGRVLGGRYFLGQITLKGIVPQPVLRLEVARLMAHPLLSCEAARSHLAGNEIGAGSTGWGVTTPTTGCKPQSSLPV